MKIEFKNDYVTLATMFPIIKGVVTAKGKADADGRKGDQEEGK